MCLTEGKGPFHAISLFSPPSLSHFSLISFLLLTCILWPRVRIGFDFPQGDVGESFVSRWVRVGWRSKIHQISRFNDGSETHTRRQNSRFAFAYHYYRLFFFSLLYAEIEIMLTLDVMSREKNNHSRLWYSFFKKRKKRTFSPAFSSPKTQRNISRICRKIRTMWKREKSKNKTKRKKHETRILKALCLICLLSFYSTCLFNGWLLSAFFLSLYPELLCKWYKYVCPPPGWLLWFFFFFLFIFKWRCVTSQRRPGNACNWASIS